MMHQTRNFLILFDIDGTLVTMAEGLPHSLFQDMVAEVYHTRVDLKHYSFSGKTDLNILREVAALAGIGPELMTGREQDAIDWLSREIEPRISRNTLELLPNVIGLLEALKQRKDTTMALLTGNLPNCADVKLRQYDLMKYFEFGVFGIESVDRNDLGWIALERAAKLHPERTYDRKDVIVIGDSIRDVECAKAIGAKCVITLTGYSEREEIEELGPDVMLEDFTDLDKTLQGIYGEALVGEVK